MRGEKEVKVPLSVSERYTIEGRFVDFGAQAGSICGVNWGIVYSVMTRSQHEEPLHIAVKMAVLVALGTSVGLLLGGGLGVLTSRFYLPRS